MSSTRTRLTTLCAAVVLSLGLAACGSTTPTTAPPASAPTAEAPDTAAESDEGDDTEEAAPTGDKVSANTASEDEIAAALEGAGVDNAERWAEEVVEYRPYPADDPNLGKLRDELAKYNPGPETTDRIVSVLTP